MTTPPVVAIPTRRPYLIRAIYEWALDCGFTPYLLIAADQPGVTVPAKFVRDGRIALDINPMAVRGLDLKRDPIYFSARFNGTAYDIWVPSGAVLAIYARENGEGVMFGEPEPVAAAAAPPITGVDSHRNDGQDPKPDPPPDAPRPSGRPKLRVVK
jgi:stringent starvation protein B